MINFSKTTTSEDNIASTSLRVAVATGGGSSALANHTVALPPVFGIKLGLTVAGISLTDLTSHFTLGASFEKSLQHSIANLAGMNIQPGYVVLEFREGSIDVLSTIVLPEASPVLASAVSATLNQSMGTGAFAATISSSIKAIPDIENLMTSPLTVSAFTAPGVSVVHSTGGSLTASESQIVRPVHVAASSESTHFTVDVVGILEAWFLAPATLAANHHAASAFAEGLVTLAGPSTEIGCSQAVLSTLRGGHFRVNYALCIVGAAAPAVEAAEAVIGALTTVTEAEATAAFVESLGYRLEGYMGQEAELGPFVTGFHVPRLVRVSPLAEDSGVGAGHAQKGTDGHAHVNIMVTATACLFQLCCLCACVGIACRRRGVWMRFRDLIRKDEEEANTLELEEGEVETAAEQAADMDAEREGPGWSRAMLEMVDDALNIEAEMDAEWDVLEWSEDILEQAQNERREAFTRDYAVASIKLLNSDPGSAAKIFPRGCALFYEVQAEEEDTENEPPQAEEQYLQGCIEVSGGFWLEMQPDPCSRTGFARSSGPTACDANPVAVCTCCLSEAGGVLPQLPYI